MKKTKVGDHVIIKMFHKNHMNRIARVEAVSDFGVTVSNINMPLYGTLCNEFFYLDEVKRIKER